MDEEKENYYLRRIGETTAMFEKRIAALHFETLRLHSLLRDSMEQVARLRSEVDNPVPVEEKEN